MKIPLRFQVTEFDCGTVSLLNAFSYLFDRDEIPAELVKAIHKYTLDCYDEEGNLINTYKSQAQAERALRLGGGAISRAIANNRKAGGYYWKKVIE